MISALEHFVF